MALALLLAGCGSVASSHPAATSGSASSSPSLSASASPTCHPAPLLADFPAASMAEARAAFAATLLRDGRVLVTGGFGAGGTALANAELYDPSCDRWSPAGSMASPRAFHTATLLPSGMVLVAGGVSNPTGNSQASAEVYDPAANTWSVAGPLRYPRAKHTATLLADGTVLVAGGTSAPGAPVAAEVYNPVSNAWAGAGRMLVDHPDGPMAARLKNGKVLLFGGTNPTDSLASGNTVELYDPATAGWAPERNYPQGGSRDYATATVLNDGTVLVVGGEPSQVGGGPILSVDIYDPNTKAWQAGLPSHFGHCGHTATLLNNGDVLVAGGRCGPPATGGPQEAAIAEVEVYHPGGGGAWIQRVRLTTGRGFATGTLLNNGQVLLAGGFDGQGSPLRTAEIYTP